MDALMEQQHLDACKRGDAAAFRPLVDTYYSRSVGLAHSLVGNGEDAKDLAQEAFVAAYRAIAQHDRTRPFYPWLRGILVNRVRMFIRTRNRARARVAVAAEQTDHWTRPHARPATDRADRDLVREALAGLDDEDRSLLVLKHVEGYTYDELAAALAIPSGTVMSRLFRARAKMRSRIEELSPRLLEQQESEPEQESP